MTVGLRVASFNVRYGRAPDGRHAWWLRRRACAAAVRGLAADVLALQEVLPGQRRYLERRLPGGVWCGRGRDAGGGEASPVVVADARLAVHDHVTRWYGATPDEPGTRLPGASHPRVATLARVEVRATGQVLQVVSTHLDQRSDERRAASITQLAGWLDPAVPRIVLGDLNCGPDDPVLAPLLDAGLRHALPDDGCGSVHGFRGTTAGPRIDHILVSDDLEVGAAGVEHPRPWHQLPSDHWPVVADLALR